MTPPSITPRLIRYENKAQLPETTKSSCNPFKCCMPPAKKVPIPILKTIRPAHHERELTQFEIDYAKILKSERAKSGVKK